MSKEAITKVVQRAISDAGFRRQLSTDPSGALRGFDLSADEAAALRTGDAGRLSALGVDQRMSKAFALGGAASAATRPGSTDLNASGLNAGGANALSNADATGAAGSMRSALVSSSDANSALIDDGAAGGARSIIPTEPHGSLSADLDGGAAARASSINDDPDGFLAANADASGGMANYPAHGGLAGPSSVQPARAGDDWARAGSGQAGDAGASSARASAINDDPDGFLAANADADPSGGTAGQTAFVDESEAYLSKIGYDANAATSAVTDAHDRGSLGTSAVTDAHDRGSVTRADDDADSAGSSAASEGGPNISS